MPLPDWARAHGAPLFAATLRSRPEDFAVTEVLGWSLSGDGEHDYLWIEKVGANTEWVARQLARHAGVPAKDIGFAGLKDRHAVTFQWFSVPRWNAPDWSALDIEGVRVVETGRHQKKLRRGAHQANRFRIVLRGESVGQQAAGLTDRIGTISANGVPNYFGEQRFGRDGANLSLADAWASGRRLPRHKRSLAISTVRSYLFNEALDRRVRQGTWNTLQPGDTANLDGTGSVFGVDTIDATLEQRCKTMDLHPAGLLAGEGCEIEPAAWCKALDKARVEPGWRSLRLRVGNLQCNVEDGAAVLSFTLPRGAFATAVIREVCET